MPALHGEVLAEPPSLAHRAPICPAVALAVTPSATISSAVCLHGSYPLGLRRQVRPLLSGLRT